MCSLEETLLYSQQGRLGHFTQQVVMIIVHDSVPVIEGTSTCWNREVLLFYIIFSICESHRCGNKPFQKFVMAAGDGYLHLRSQEYKDCIPNSTQYYFVCSMPFGTEPQILSGHLLFGAYSHDNRNLYRKGCSTWSEMFLQQHLPTKEGEIQQNVCFKQNERPPFIHVFTIPIIMNAN